jgi:tetratricopeptide (TPR) repeat protein
MRWIAKVSMVVGVCMGTAASVRGGLYNSAEPAGVLSRNFRKFQDTLIPLRQIGAPGVHSLLADRYDLIATLAARGARPTLTVEQSLDLSGYLIRQRKYREAVNLLTPAQFKERDNFLVLSNLATAEQLDGQPRRARDYLADALRLWPKEWSSLSEARRKWFGQIGWNERDFGWYREVETYQLRLLRLRSKEPSSQAGGLPENVDALFDEDGQTQGRLKFVGPSGQYEAGKLAPAERVKLPRNAIEIVEQLLVWMPHDNRLYWLLGELFNAEGDIPAAQAIFEEAAVKWDPKTSKSAGAQMGFKRDADLPPLFKAHLDVLRAQPSAEVVVSEPTPLSPPTAAAAVSGQEAATGPPVEWKSLGVGFGIGLVVAFFAYWQIREIRRRAGRTAPSGS